MGLVESESKLQGIGIRSISIYTQLHYFSFLSCSQAENWRLTVQMADNASFSWLFPPLWKQVTRDLNQQGKPIVSECQTSVD